MKGLITVILILICFTTKLFSQEIKEPFYYLDSKPIYLNKVFLNPSRIDSVYVDKSSDNGKIFIYSKDGEFTYYKITDILEKYTNIKDIRGSMLFRINGEVLQDTSSIQIDDTYFVYVDIERLNGVKYIPNKFRSLIIVNIDLESKKRKPEIYIRGNQVLHDKVNNVRD